jgi:hypothetical protein
LKSGPKNVLPTSFADFGAAETGSDSDSSSVSESYKKHIFSSLHKNIKLKTCAISGTTHIKTVSSSCTMYMLPVLMTSVTMNM